MSANNDPLFEAVLRQAVIDHSQDEIERLSTEKEDEVVISDLCDQRIKNLIGQKKHSTFGIRRIVVAVIIFIVVSTGVMMAVPQARAAIFDTIAEWMDKRTRFQKNVIGEDSLLYEPTLLPKGYEAVQNNEGVLTSLVFKNNVGKVLVFAFSTNINQTSVNNEGVISYRAYKEEREYYVTQSNQDTISNTITWYMDDLWFRLTGNMTTDDLMIIARSIMKTK